MNAENLKAAEAVETQEGTAIIREVWVEAERKGNPSVSRKGAFCLTGKPLLDKIKLQVKPWKIISKS